MDLSSLADVVLIIALLGWFGYRQTVWAPVSPARLWRAPLILVVIGLVIMARSALQVSAVEVALLAVEVLLSLGAGMGMGMLARFRPLGTPVERGKNAGARYESRTGWLGLLLWIVLLAARIGIDAVAHQLGAVALTSSGVILLVFGVNRLVRSAVIVLRLERHAAVSA